VQVQCPPGCAALLRAAEAPAAWLLACEFAAAAGLLTMRMHVWMPQVRSSKHWPPRMVEALQRFIQLD
jgi:hypothetical protein